MLELTEDHPITGNDLASFNNLWDILEPGPVCETVEATVGA